MNDQKEGGRTCETHQERKHAYCSSCKELVCQRCVHNPDHEVKEVAQLAAESEAAFTVDSRTLKRLVVEAKDHVSTVHRNLLASSEKLQNDLTICLNAIQAEMDKTCTKSKQRLNDLFASIFATLDEGAVEREFEEKKRTLQTWLQQERYSELVCWPELDTTQTVQKYNDVVIAAKQYCLHAVQEIEGRNKEAQRLLHALQTFRDHDLASPGVRCKDENKHTVLLKEVQESLREQMRLRQAMQKLNAELQIERATLQEEIASCNEKKMQQLTVFKQILEELEKKQMEYQTYDRKIQSIQQLIKDSQMEIEVLESFIKKKQELLREVDTLLMNRCKSPQASAVTKQVPLEVVQQVAAAEAEHQLAMMQSNLLHFYDAKAYILYVYHLELHKTFRVTPKEYSIPTNPDSVQIRNHIYLSGGFDPKTIQYTRATAVFTLIANEKVHVTSIGNMVIPKSQHKLVALDLTTIYSLGGKNKDERFLNVCERLDLKANMWTKTSPLNEKKFYVSATGFACSSIYAFGGFNGTHLSTIERLFPAVEDRWQIVKVSSGPWTPRDELGCFQRSDHEILLFGGTDSSKGSIDEVLIFDVNTAVVTKQERGLQSKDWFAMRTPVRHLNMIHIVGYFRRDIHTYDISTQLWSMTTDKNWDVSP